MGFVCVVGTFVLYMVLLIGWGVRHDRTAGGGK
jgi:hypothetical protein